MFHDLFLVPKKGKEFSKHHGESCYTQATANNVNKLGDIYKRSVILIGISHLAGNKWTQTFFMLNLSFSSVREQSGYIPSMVQNFALN